MNLLQRIASLSEPNGPEGWEALPNFAGYVKRCEQHRFRYPETARHEYGYPPVDAPVLLTQPVRTLTITGFSEPKRDVTPDGKWAHGSPENCGDPSCPDCEHKPRGGFEFL